MNGASEAIKEMLRYGFYYDMNIQWDWTRSEFEEVKRNFEKHKDETIEIFGEEEIEHIVENLDEGKLEYSSVEETEDDSEYDERLDESNANYLSEDSDANYLSEDSDVNYLSEDEIYHN